MVRGLIATIVVLSGVVAAMRPSDAVARIVYKRPVAEARFGLINPRAPRLGPKLVRRGGYTALTDMARSRYSGGMTDVYPLGSIGLHISFGSRYFARANYWTTAEQASHGLLLDPRWRGGGGVSTGFRRRTYALTAGYDAEVSPGLVVGLEGGAIKGRAISLGPRGRAFGLRDRSNNRAGLNPIATLSMRYAF